MAPQRVQLIDFQGSPQGLLLLKSCFVLNVPSVSALLKDSLGGKGCFFFHMILITSRNAVSHAHSRADL